MDDVDRDKIGFAVRFLPAIVKLRDAKTRGEGATLTPDEVVGLIEGFSLLKDRARTA